MSNKPLTARQLRCMVGCGVSYRGRWATVLSVRPDMERLGLPSLCLAVEGSGIAVIRPSELA
jgi:hypothetical protein